MRTRRRSWWSSSICVLVAFGATACAGSQDESALTAAQAYAAALADGDGDVACAVLAPSVRSELEQTTGKACERAILDEGVVTEGHGLEVLVFGTSAQVRLDDDTVFLSRFQDGWHVTAAACSPTPRGVYDCRVKAS